jgi:glycosyltransferase involved in cell wall biosynthesis
MRILTLVGNSYISNLRPSETRALEVADQIPRRTVYEDVVHSDMVDNDFFDEAPPWRKRLYVSLPPMVAQVAEACTRGHGYDAFVSWGERPAILLAALMKLSAFRKPHVGLFSWVSAPKKAPLFRVLQSHIDRFVLWSTVQRDYAIQHLRIPPDKIILTRWGVDTKFWRPIQSETDMICAAGREMRDYETLVEAMRALDIPCQIAAIHIKGKRDRWQELSGEKHRLPPHVTFGSKNPLELRQLYARSKFVVIPLIPTDTDNGLNCILEAMAMGKAVICSRTTGQRDVIQEGKTGLYVEPRNPRALRDAIGYLWNHPEIAKGMGEQGRRHVEQYHTQEHFAEDVKRAIAEALRDRECCERSN